MTATVPRAWADTLTAEPRSTQPSILHRMVKQLHRSSRMAVYSHMPILRPHAVRYSTNIASLIDESASARTMQIRLIWGFWGSKVPQNERFPALEEDEPPCKV